MKVRAIFFLFVFGFTACTSPQPVDIQGTAVALAKTGVALTQTVQPTATLPPTVTPTATVTYPTPSPYPTQKPLPIFTPDAIQVERWKEYQTELAKNLLSFLPSEAVLCEWDILGQFDQGIFAWAVCEGVSGGTSAPKISTPVVIRFEADGAVQNVEHPKHWSQDIQRMFPAEIQEKFDYYNFGRASELSQHIEWRRTHPEEPPLVVLSATSAP